MTDVVRYTRRKSIARNEEWPDIKRRRPNKESKGKTRTTAKEEPRDGQAEGEEALTKRGMRGGRRKEEGGGEQDGREEGKKGKNKEIQKAAKEERDMLRKCMRTSR